jgi:hypothetical protein
MFGDLQEGTNQRRSHHILRATRDKWKGAGSELLRRRVEEGAKGGQKGPGSVGSPRFSLGQAVILDQLIEAPEGREQVRQS